MPIDYYEVERMDEENGKWVPCAKVKDTNAQVTGLKKGQTYQFRSVQGLYERCVCFRVKAVNKEGASDPLTTDHGTVAKNPYDVAGRPGTPDIVDWGTDHMDLGMRLAFNLV